MKKLILPTLRTFLMGFVILGLLLFLPAWTLAYWQAWLFIVVFLLSVSPCALCLVTTPTAKASGLLSLHPRPKAGSRWERRCEYQLVRGQEYSKQHYERGFATGRLPYSVAIVDSTRT